MRSRARWIVLVLAAGWLLLQPAEAQQAASASDESMALPMGIEIKFDNASTPQEVSKSIQILLLLTLLSLAPSAVIMTTSFMRILIVFGFMRQAIGTQQSPPGQVLSAMALFLTAFIMMPIWQQINTEALQPYLNEEITQQEAWNTGVAPLRDFMMRQTGQSEMALFTGLARGGAVRSEEELGLDVIVPAFMISELKKAFQMGFLIYLPFLIIDMVIATTLMAMGMMMLPPMMVSLPLKLLFFVLADGWTVMIRSLVASFSM